MYSFTNWDRSAGALSERRYPSSARTEAIYDKWIFSNDVFEKFITSAICASVCDDEPFEHIRIPAQHFQHSVKSIVQRLHRLRWNIGPLSN
ncbi:hypothetical protein TNCV_2680321 [Trichonephila clavipes]|uniref:Uncharacterized protein n=1 Tax=Trichonephila clavipes TaxID=2585209 RepID=A0A8X6S7I8_TRICX|nr:hypothetical protein TNCV_2680321 [Trichonephila clavipes]